MFIKNCAPRKLLAPFVLCAAMLLMVTSASAQDVAPLPRREAVSTSLPMPPPPAQTVSPAPSATPTASPSPDDLGESEPSAEDVALEDDPAQQQQPTPVTEQDEVFTSVQYKQSQTPGQGGVATINYETSGPTEVTQPCARVIRAHVVALDQVFFWNRLGAVQPQGMIFALRHQVVPTDGSNMLRPGRVRLRADKRPRPLVLRMNVGDCLQIDFQNLLDPEPRDEEQPATRTASVHVAGLQLVNSIRDDGSNVGRNPIPPGGLVRPGERIVYTLYADERMREGSNILFSAAATTTGEGDGGQIPPGLFGAVNVEPRGARWYRSQLTHNELRLAAKRNSDGTIMRTEDKPGINGGQPILNYDAVYPDWHRYRRQPILKILNRNGVIVHSDLTAIITGENLGKLPAGTYPPVAVAPNRDWPFREFTLVYHDEIGAVQAFPQFEQDGPGGLADTLHGGRDAFAINYGTGGIGAEILANRLNVGPMAFCDECLFEEFFLSAWAVGDPAMVVDVPANAPCRPGSESDNVRDGLRDGLCTATQSNPTPGYKATKAFYPHDPSNVYHSYLNDHTKMRVLHAGPKEHHIHHLHTHQWLKSADGDQSSYNDSQAIGPGSSVNLEIAYGGGGNRNLTPGDAIFHCHFYPHFAQGMWALWRVHDVFEEGTQLDRSGRPASGARALPDAEIKRGTPIPAIIPLPGGDTPAKANYVMAPVPQAKAEIVDGQIKVTGTGNPGYPFFVPGTMGRRPPHPPLDTEFDAGLPRHIIRDADVALQEQTRLSFNKELGIVIAEQLPEDGTGVEKSAMQYHSEDFHTSYRTDGSTGRFMTNGLVAKPGAPYADPCVNPRWLPDGTQVFEAEAFGRNISYKGVMFQFDMKINKAGWHFPQSRIESLWRDYDDYRLGRRAPEPLFFRANTDDCVTFLHANLIPRIYRLDDFQVKTPTDIVGQHIHLVKFDVTSSDGAANGWNYEDGTFGDEEVVDRINHINLGGGIIGLDGMRRTLTAVNHPFFGRPTQVTVQRWLVDNVLSLTGEGSRDRTLRNAFTHDHFGPSTHQQVGLYAGLIIEPKGSTWLHNEDGTPLGIGNGTAPPRDDGGPTSFAAVIVTEDPADSYREFLLQLADFQLAYLPGGGINAAGEAVPDPQRAINPPGRREVPLPRAVPPPGGPFGFDTRLLERPFRQRCHNGDPAPCPEIISADDPGTFVVNYRNEPIPLRVRNPWTNRQAAGQRGDLSFVYRSMSRVDPVLNRRGPYPPLTPGVRAFDPFTPLLRAGESDRVQMRLFVGAHEEGHNFSVNGVKWLFEPFDLDSGWRNSQMMGISEKYDFILRGRAPQGAPGTTPVADFLYRPGASVDDQWNGLWGILRTYQTAGSREAFLQAQQVNRARSLNTRVELPPFPLPIPVFARNASLTEGRQAQQTFSGSCPVGATKRRYNVSAYMARAILPGGRLNFTGQNGHTFSVLNADGGMTGAGPLNDPTAIIFVRDREIGRDGKYNRARVEPLILRANAGECVVLKLTNRLPKVPVDLPGYNTLPMIVDDFNANQVVPSRHVGLHPQLVHYDMRARNDGMNVGINPIQTVGPGMSITYQWYAGDVGIELGPNQRNATPVEFGAINLMSSDPIKHSNKSAIGSLIIEPPCSKWPEDTDSTHSATVSPDTEGPCATQSQSWTPFREFTLQFQNDLNLRFNDRSAVPNLAESEDPEDSGQKAFNYRTEPFWTRLCYWPALPLSMGLNWPPASQCPQSDARSTRRLDMTNSLHNTQIGGLDPVTPIFKASVGQPVRFRVLHSGGHARNNTFMVHGHIWQEMPYKTGSASTVIGINDTSAWHGAQWGHGPSNHFDVVFERAGGKYGITGDYLFRTFQSFQFDGGMWGLLRVEAPQSQAGQPSAQPGP
jgi:manganese oxidase